MMNEELVNKFNTLRVKFSRTILKTWQIEDCLNFLPSFFEHFALNVVATDMN